MKLQLVAAAAAAALLLGSTATADVDDGEQSVRVERFFRQGPAASYSGDSGTILQRPLGEVRTPRASRVDVVVAMTFEYRVTEDAMGTMAMLYDANADGPALKRLRPHEFRFASEGRLWGATTLQWYRRALPGDGRVYSFEAFANLDSGFVRDTSIQTRNLVVTIDVRPSGG